MKVLGDYSYHSGSKFTSEPLPLLWTVGVTLCAERPALETVPRYITASPTYFAFTIVCCCWIVLITIGRATSENCPNVRTTCIVRSRFVSGGGGGGFAMSSDKRFCSASNLLCSASVTCSLSIEATRQALSHGNGGDSCAHPTLT